jgi:hypothetical protein
LRRFTRYGRLGQVLISCWTLVDDDWDLIANKAGASRLGFALLLKSAPHKCLS